MKPYFQFPTGECHCNAGDDETGHTPSCFEHRIYIPYDRTISINDWFMQVVLASHAINDSSIDVWLPYLPYSRQDRPAENQPFSLSVISKLLNEMPCRRIITLDVHSDVAFGLIPKLKNIGVDEIWTDFFEWSSVEKTLVIPDAGAFKKLNKIGHWFKNVVTGMKERDTATGHLTLKGLHGDVKDNHCLIFDDICDGGGTFVQLAKALYDQGANIVDLVVTHGIFTKGTQVLRDAGIRHIYTTDSFKQTDQLLIVMNASGWRNV